MGRGVCNGLREKAIVILVKELIGGSGRYPGSPVLGLPWFFGLMKILYLGLGPLVQYELSSIHIYSDISLFAISLCS